MINLPAWLSYKVPEAYIPITSVLFVIGSSALASFGYRMILRADGVVVKSQKKKRRKKRGKR